MSKHRTASQVGRLSRRKGKKFENWCARYFTQWTGLKWSSTRNSGRTDLRGDIYCVSRPDLPLVVECKHRAVYSVHAMLKPTKAFTDMVTKYFNRSDDVYVILVKNETDTWIWSSHQMIMTRRVDAIRTKYFGLWVKLHDVLSLFKINGVIFNGQRMDSAGKTGEG